MTSNDLKALGWALFWMAVVAAAVLLLGLYAGWFAGEVR